MIFSVCTECVIYWKTYKFAPLNQTKLKMLEYKTVKYHIPQRGIYLYARTNEGKTEMIVLNSTDKEQTLPSEHYNALTNGRKTGTEIASGKQVDFTRNLVLPARQSLVIEF